MARRATDHPLGLFRGAPAPDALAAAAPAGDISGTSIRRAGDAAGKIAGCATTAGVLAVVGAADAGTVFPGATVSNC